MTGNPTPSAGDGRSIALAALESIAAKKNIDGRLSDLTLERVVDIAWRHQFAPGDRAKAKTELREALQPEVAKRVAGDS